MAYLGNTNLTQAFPFDQFSGTGSKAAFTLTYAAAGPSSVLVMVSGVVQNPNSYGIIGNTLTFTEAPPSGTNNIVVLYLGLPAIAVSTPGNTAYRQEQEFTATAGQTLFTLNSSYTPGFIVVYQNGVKLGSGDFSATNGTSFTLTTGAIAGDLITAEWYNLTSIANALPISGGTMSGLITQPKLPCAFGRMALTTVTGPGLIPWDTTPVLQNISYNSTTRRFTVNAAGKYLVTFTGFKLQDTNAARVRLGINTDVPDATTDQGQIYVNTPQTAYGPMAMTSIVSLQANDYLAFYLQAGTLYAASNDPFNQCTIHYLG